MFNHALTPREVKAVGGIMHTDPAQGLSRSDKTENAFFSPKLK